MLTENNRILPSEDEIPKPTWIAYPSWLTMDCPGLGQIYADIAAMREYYVVFATMQNPVAMKGMANGLMGRLKHLTSDVCNPYDYSLSSLQFTKDQVHRLNDGWRLTLDGIVDHMGATDFDLGCEIVEGQPAKITGGGALEGMHLGMLQEDFLYRHPVTQTMFYRFSTIRLMELIRERMVNLGQDIKNTTNLDN